MKWHLRLFDFDACPFGAFPWRPGRFIKRRINQGWFANDVGGWNSSPESAVQSIITTISQHEVLAGGNFERLTSRVFHAGDFNTMISLAVIIHSPASFAFRRKLLVRSLFRSQINHHPPFRNLPP